MLPSLASHPKTKKWGEPPWLSPHIFLFYIRLLKSLHGSFDHPVNNHLVNIADLYPCCRNASIHNFRRCFLACISFKLRRLVHLFRSLYALLRPFYYLVYLIKRAHIGHQFAHGIHYRIRSVQHLFRRRYYPK